MLIDSENLYKRYFKCFYCKKLVQGQHIGNLLKKIAANSIIACYKCRSAHPSKRRGPPGLFPRKFKKMISSAIRGSFWNVNLGRHTLSIEDLIGCSQLELLKHIESQFEPGMNWDNYGNKGEICWSLDHIIPVASFVPTDINEMKQCFNFKNLQPRWYLDNLHKMDKMPDGTLGRQRRKKIMNKLY